MNPTLPIPQELLSAFLSCEYKAYLKAVGSAEEQSDFEQLQARLSKEYVVAARQHFLRKYHQAAFLQDPLSLCDAIKVGHQVFIDVTAIDDGKIGPLPALERADSPRPSSGKYVTVLFARPETLAPYHKVLLAFNTSIFSRIRP
jgi:hypothetical protein